MHRPAVPAKDRLEAETGRTLEANRSTSLTLDWTGCAFIYTGLAKSGCLTTINKSCGHISWEVCCDTSAGSANPGSLRTLVAFRRVYNKNGCQQRAWRTVEREPIFPQLCSFLIRHWEAWGQGQEKDDFEICAAFLYGIVHVKWLKARDQEGSLYLKTHSRYHARHRDRNNNLYF